MKKMALLIIDVQNGMFEEEYPVYNGENLILNLKQLINSARSHQIPIFYIQHNEQKGLVHGTEAWQIYHEIAPHSEDIIIQKTTPDSFYQTNLLSELKKKEINHLVLSGIQTDICVDTTCRNAYSLDFQLTLVSDAHSTWNSSSLTAKQIIEHHNSVLQWFAEIKKTEEIQWG